MQISFSPRSIATSLTLELFPAGTILPKREQTGEVAARTVVFTFRDIISSVVYS